MFVQNMTWSKSTAGSPSLLLVAAIVSLRLPSSDSADLPEVQLNTKNRLLSLSVNLVKAAGNIEGELTVQYLTLRRTTLHNIADFRPYVLRLDTTSRLCASQICLPLFDSDPASEPP